jgi:hypothetical protein
LSASAFEHNRLWIKPERMLRLQQQSLPQRGAFICDFFTIL